MSCMLAARKRECSIAMYFFFGLRGGAFVLLCRRQRREVLCLTFSNVAHSTRGELSITITSVLLLNFIRDLLLRESLIECN